MKTPLAVLLLLGLPFLADAPTDPGPQDPVNFQRFWRQVVPHARGGPWISRSLYDSWMLYHRLNRNLAFVRLRAQTSMRGEANG